MKNRFAVSLRRAIGLVVLSAFGLMVLGASPVFAWHLQGCDVATPCAGFTTHINPSTFVGTGSWAFTTVGPCEPFNVTAAPPHSVPEFPLGLPALLALALPAMILLRRRLPHA